MLIVFLLFTTIVHAQEALITSSVQAQGTIYVLLDKKELPDGQLWTIGSEQGVVISDLHNERRSDTLSNTSIALEAQGGRLSIDQRKGPRQITIKPVSGELSVGKYSYSGSLNIIYKDNMWYLVNGVELEYYVGSVLASESWPGWPLEVNRLLAIVLRTYVIAKRIEARKKIKPGQVFIYDVLNTNMHQTYRGSHKHKILWQAVEETRGIVLTHKQKPILAMYDACCGGIIPANIKHIDFSNKPYLARPYACEFCKKSCTYSWNALYTLEDIINFVKTHDKHFAKVQRMYIASTDKAGLVQEIVIHSGKKHIKLPVKKIYSHFKKIKSYAFSVTRQPQGYLFEGKGYGHHLGLCQWGARKMIELGWSWTDILKFYYPEVEFMLITWK
jgi:stage II sporulation protein D